MSVLSINQLSVFYQSHHVIDDLALSVEKGEIVALFGPSGGGKSTVLKAIAGLLPEATGHIEIENQTLLDNNTFVPIEQRQIGLIFQDYALFPHLTVAENVAFGLKHLSSKQQQLKVSEMLELIKLSDVAKSYPHQLSGGQQQRVAIVRALAREPKLLLFDEAFSNIDPLFRFELIADIRTLLNQQQIAALFVTHNQDEAFAFCDRIAILNQGKIEQIDSPERLFNFPDTAFVAEFLGEGLWLDASIQDGNLLETEFGELPYQGDQDLTQFNDKQVRIYIRPHQLELIPSESASYVVHAERFVGAKYQSEIEWQGQIIQIQTSQSFLNKVVNIKVNANVFRVFNKI